jgi:cytochrome c5
MKHINNLKNRRKQQYYLILFVNLILVFGGFWILDGFAQDSVKSREANLIYKTYCASCHNGGFKGWMTGAPKIKEIDEWKPYFEKGVDEMTHNVYTGEKKHEIKGECEDCSKTEIRAVVSHIVSATQ